MSKSPEEALLVRAAQGGDREAFARLHATYAPWVHAIALARVPRHEVDDLVQEVLITAWRRVRTLRDPAAFGGWLGQIARNRAIDFHRRRRANAPLPDELATKRSGAETHARVNEALEAIRALPEAYRETLILRLVEGWTGPEIAARTGLTAGSVRVNLHRGMALLREKLGSREAS